VRFSAQRFFRGLLLFLCCYLLFCWIRRRAKRGLVKHVEIETQLDPHLQDILIRMREGCNLRRHLRSSKMARGDFVDVVARLQDPARPIDGLRLTSIAGNTVAGELSMRAITAVRHHPNVVSLKCARPLRAELDVSLSSISGSPQQLAGISLGGLSAPTGVGVLVGIVDDGCDFRHENFRDANGFSRILFLWDQTLPSLSPPHPYSYGREITAADLNQAMTREDPYASVGHRPKPGCHGTHVMDIATGNGRGTGLPGVAPEASIIFVHCLATDSSGEQQLGNSKQLLDALDYIFRKGDELGLATVVNLSLSTNGGPHDGSTPVEQFFEQKLAASGRAIVIAAGNSRDDFTHASGSIAVGGRRQLRWDVSNEDDSENELEVWYSGGTRLGLVLRSPSGKVFSPEALGNTTLLKNANNQVIASVHHRAADSANGDNHLDIIFRPSMQEGGTWIVQLINLANVSIPFHAWIETDASDPSRFAQADFDPSCTIGSIACGATPLVVGAYDAHQPDNTITVFSAQGPTRDGKQKPDLCAPGENVRAAKAVAHNEVIAKLGTSMAAPHVTGTVALLFEAAGKNLTIQQIRETLLNTVRSSGLDWDALHGFGDLNAAAALRKLTNH
jgi:subtilisin family serine protease